MALENDQLQKEIHFIELSEEEQQKLQRRKTIKSYLLVILGTLIYSVGVVWILRIGGFFSGGVTGTSQLIVGLIEKFGGSSAIRGYLGMFVGLINVPLCLIGWRGVSKRFVILIIFYSNNNFLNNRLSCRWNTTIIIDWSCCCANLVNNGHTLSNVTKSCILTI